LINLVIFGLDSKGVVDNFNLLHLVES